MQLTLYIAFAPNDREDVELLLHQLEALDGKIPRVKVNKLWYDGSRDSDPDSKAEFRTFLYRADVVLLFVTKDFLTSDYYISDTVQGIIGLAIENKAQVVPVIARACWWEETRLRQLPPLPPSGVPLEESGAQAGKIWQQAMELLVQKLKTAQEKRRLEEQQFKQLVKDAHQLFEDWQSNPESLPDIRDLYAKALALHHPTLSPSEDLLKTRIALCEREIDFRYYASAAENAYRIKDYKGTLYHAKDALNLRDDARMQRIMKLAREQMDQSRIQEKQVPYNAHLAAADAAFLALDWVVAEREYEAALAYHETGFKPERQNLLRKIEISIREYQTSIYIDRCEKALAEFDYETALHHLDLAMRSEQPKVIQLGVQIHDLIEQERNLEKFLDETTRLWGYYDKRTEIVVIPPRYEEVYGFSEHLAGVKKNGKWGFIDIQGNVVVPFTYDFVAHFEKGVSEVMLQGKKKYINRRGEIATR